MRVRPGPAGTTAEGPGAMKPGDCGRRRSAPLTPTADRGELGRMPILTLAGTGRKGECNPVPTRAPN